VVRKQTKEHHM